MATFILDGNKVNIDYDKTLFDLAKEMGTPLPSSCINKGSCKECIIEIKKGNQFLTPITTHEEYLNDPFRLACQCKVKVLDKDIEALTLARPLLQIEGSGTGILYLNFDEPAITQNNNQIYFNNEVIATTTSGQVLGAIIDIGTTTVVLKIIDIPNRKIKASIAFENPQRFSGSNVMSRILYDSEHGKKELKRVLNAQIAQAFSSICSNPEHIFEVILAGNSTMRDLYLGLNVESIGVLPYQSITEIHLLQGKVTHTALHGTAHSLHLPLAPKAHVYALPLIGGHVGADTAAGLLSIQLMEEENLVVFMDIGTNTEVVIGNKYKALAASSPSGPSFEGGGIHCGMPAMPGAVERVWVDENQRIVYSTINDEVAIGLCGSGLLDALSVLRKTGVINEMGRFEEDIKAFFFDENQSVYLNEYDINLLAQTKGANAAALRILIKEYGVNFNQIDKFYIAGGFGKHIDVEAAVDLGLLPDIERSKFYKLGNACIDGLQIALFSQAQRRQLEAFVQGITQVNLESDSAFFDFFVDGCIFQKMVQ